MFNRKQNPLHDDSNYFLILFGAPGMGKTLTSVEYDVLPDLILGLQVYSNIWINWNKPNIHYYNSIYDILNVRNSLIFFDEIANVIDPRDWASEDQSVRNFFRLRRHRYNAIVANTQQISQVPKSALILANYFEICEKRTFPLINFFVPSFGFNIVRYESSLIELKQEERYANMFHLQDEDDIDFVYSNSRKNYYSTKKLFHPELDDSKVELVHHYCHYCKARHNPKIKKEETKYFVQDKKDNYGQYIPRQDRKKYYCPKHNIELDIRTSAMFDSYYDLEFEEKKVIFKPYSYQKKLMPFNGNLSERQIDLKKQLEQNEEYERIFSK